MKTHLSVLTIIALLVVPAMTLADSTQELQTEAVLTGNQEVPARATTMEGDVAIEIKNDVLKFSLSIRNNTKNITAGHIHCAAPGVNGPVGISLFAGSFTAESGLLASGTIKAPDPKNGCNWTSIADVFAAIESGKTYVNIHTTAASGGFPGGEIRGNLSAEGNNQTH